MKLHELAQGSYFRIQDGLNAPPGAPPVDKTMVYKLNNIDGMYSHCHDDSGNVVHVVAWAEVEEVAPPAKRTT
jgi:hypothetical protein